MARLSTWLGGALGLAALWRFLRREQEAQRRLPEPPPPEPDPAAELRARLDAAREAPDDRDEFDAAEGQPVDEAEPVAPEEPPMAPEPTEPPSRSLDERRRAIHEKAQEALGEMQRPGADE
jgi:hypothetical protein